MPSKSNIIAGLDLGSSKVAVVVAEILPQDAGKEDRITVLGVGCAPSRGLRKGVVINIESTVAAIGEALSQAEKMAGVQISSVYAAIGGSHVKGFNSHGIVAVRGNEVSKRDVERVIEAAKAVAIPMDREVLHVLPQDFIIDGQDGIKEPVGMSGVRLEAHVQIVTGSVASAQNVVKCANRCGLTVRDIIISQLAAAEAVLTPEERELGVCLVDIGGGTTDIVVFHGGAVRHSAVLPVGGNHISNDVAAGLRTPIAAAEEIKQKHGNADLQQVGSDEIIEVPSTGGRAPRVISKQVLTEIIQPRVEEIFTLVRRELISVKCEHLLTAGLVLTGGTAQLRNISTVAEQIFHIPTRVGKPSGASGLSELVAGTEFASSLGLVLRVLRRRDAALYRSNQRRFWGALRKVNEWFGGE